MAPEPAGESAALAGLREALRAGEGEVAFLLFRDVLEERADPQVLSWAEAALDAFGLSAGRGGWRHDLQAAREDATAARLLFARAAFGAGYPAPALADVRAALHREPAVAAPAFLLCAMLLKQGDGEAQALLRHCLARFPQPSRGWADLGHLLLGLGKREAALVCFARGEPDCALAIQQGLIARELGRREAARAHFAEAARLDASSPRAWFLLGTAAQDAHDLAAAAAAYRAVLARDPGRAEAAVNLGTVLQEAGDLEGAKAAYAQAVARRAETFGRVAQALATSPKGELWLDLGALRRSLAG